MQNNTLNKIIKVIGDVVAFIISAAIILALGFFAVMAAFWLIIHAIGWFM